LGLSCADTQHGDLARPEFGFGVAAEIGFRAVATCPDRPRDAFPGDMFVRQVHAHAVRQLLVHELARLFGTTVAAWLGEWGRGDEPGVFSKQIHDSSDVLIEPRPLEGECGNELLSLLLAM